MLQQLARFLAPPCCLRCHKEGELVCATCWPRVFQPLQAYCAGTAGVTAAGPYAGELRELIGRLKYNHQREAATVLANALLPCLEPKRFEFDVVTAVPVATSRLRQRGYSQAELIAKRLARGLTLPYRRPIVRVRATQQVGKSRAERLTQVEGAFASKGTISGLRILLVDDVLTTGATLSECARALKLGGAIIVEGAVAARD